MKQMLFIYALLGKTDSMEKTQTQAWFDRIALKGVSPGRAKEERAQLLGHMGRASLPGRGSTVLCLRGNETSMTPPLEEVCVFAADLVTKWASHYWELFAVSWGAGGSDLGSRTPITCAAEARELLEGIYVLLWYGCMALLHKLLLHCGNNGPIVLNGCVVGSKSLWSVWPTLKILYFLCRHSSVWKKCRTKYSSRQAWTVLLNSLTGDLGAFTAPHQNAELWLYVRSRVVKFDSAEVKVL